MQKFLHKVAEAILNKHKNLEEVVVITPNLRSGLFFKREIVKLISKSCFLPKIDSLDNWIQDFVKINHINRQNILLEYFDSIKDISNDSFEDFYKWSNTAFLDFDLINLYDVEAKTLFNYLYESKKIEAWSPENQTSKGVEKFISFWEMYQKTYSDLEVWMKNQNIFGRGKVYQIAKEKAINKENSNVHFYFIGLNALSKTEEEIIFGLEKKGFATVFWDIDKKLLQKPFEAGLFFRRYKEERYQNNRLTFETENLSNKKNIEVISSVKNISQINYCAQLLQQYDSKNELKDTVVVLADENLLVPLLLNLPESISDANISMGYPLKNHVITNLFYAFIEVFESKIDENEEKFVLEKFQLILENPFFQKLNFLDIYSKEIKSKVFENPSFFISTEEVNSLFLETLLNGFFEAKSNIQILDNLFELSNYITKQKITKIEKEIVLKIQAQIKLIKEQIERFTFLNKVSSSLQLFDLNVRKESLHFIGEPLEGVQILGLLETRCLDFKNIIMLSVNEGNLPKPGRPNSLIPYPIAKEFGLPTIEENEAVFSYHFFRLISKAENIHLLYNSESDAMGGGEKSRYILQLEHHLPKEYFSYKNINTSILNEDKLLEFIPRNNLVLDKLNKVIEKGLSASSLNLWINEPVEFYNRKIIGIPDIQISDKTISPMEMGNVIHYSLAEIYTPYLNKILTEKDVSEMQKEVDSMAEKFFEYHYISKEKLEGNNLIAFEVVKSYLNNFFEEEKKLVNKNELIVLDVERKITANIFSEKLNKTIKLYGEIDRIDSLNGKKRIVDYKTGNVVPSDLSFKEVDLLFLPENKKFLLQLLFYGVLFYEEFKTKEDIDLGLYSIKKIKQGILNIKFPKGEYPIQNIISDFKNELINFVDYQLTSEDPFFKEEVI